MKVVAVILEAKILQKIMKSLGIKEKILWTGNPSKGPPQKESGGGRKSYELKYEKEYDDCFDADYSDQF